ncbi:hypothetical protein KXD40_001771 [Peronospora effusa]|uniref:Aldehyde dehydrogenase domain-containing protein n=1 Tax=Peronospora effusa TaxID=542832 RepID=A0A3M6VEF8_9STRA|nr:hypothetical protein DD238_005668 [Peronospora effusa]UIZ26094.1 hypothetical protein KXD40_001771 [Peronospora effusa]
MSDPIPQLKDFFVNGKWVAPVNKKYIDVLNPANEEVIKQVSHRLGRRRGTGCTGGEASVRDVGRH